MNVLRFLSSKIVCGSWVIPRLSCDMQLLFWQVFCVKTPLPVHGPQSRGHVHSFSKLSQLKLPQVFGCGACLQKPSMHVSLVPGLLSSQFWHGYVFGGFAYVNFML